MHDEGDIKSRFFTFTLYSMCMISYSTESVSLYNYIIADSKTHSILSHTLIMWKIMFFNHMIAFSNFYRNDHIWVTIFYESTIYKCRAYYWDVKETKFCLSVGLMDGKKFTPFQIQNMTI